MCEKAEARKRFRALREGLKDSGKDAAIARLALQAFGSYESFFVYLSFRTETGTEALIGKLKALGKRVCAPRVLGNEMRSVLLSDKLVMGRFGTWEPEEDVETTCALAFTPLLAADEEGYRLGYGGGFYDRYFSAHPEVLRVGLAYEGQFTRRLPHEETDMRLDALVTEAGVRYFARSRLKCPGGGRDA